MTEAEPSAVLEPIAARQITRKRRLLVAFLSAAIPGAGHLLLRKHRKGSVLLALFVVLLACFWPLRLLRFYYGFLGLYFSWCALAIYAVCSSHQVRRERDSIAPSKWWFALLIPAGIVILSLTGAMVTRLAGFRSFSIPSTSMENTILVGDRLVADFWTYRHRHPKRQDVIIFKREDIFIIKRVIGTGGDVVQIEDAEVILNGVRQYEPYVIHTGHADDSINNFGPVTVPAGQFFVMGDNRDVSYDSRAAGYGFVPDRAIVGSALYVFGSEREGRNIR